MTVVPLRPTQNPPLGFEYLDGELIPALDAARRRDADRPTPDPVRVAMGLALAQATLELAQARSRLRMIRRAVALTIAAAILAWLVAPTPARAEMPRVEPILSVAAVDGPSQQIRICTGAKGGAYFSTASQMLGLAQAASGLPVSVEPGGGTVGCLRRLAAGAAEAAVIQLDGLVWAQQTSPELAARLGAAAQVLTEDMAAVCRRDIGADDLNDLAQRRDSVIAVAGGAQSGSLLTLNVLASFDKDFAAPAWRLSGSWGQALNDVRGGLAACAFGVMSFDAPEWRDLNDGFGETLRLVGFWDGDMRGLKLAGRQVYGWRAIPKDTRTLDRLLDWSGSGRRWAPEGGAVPAIVVYRTDMLPTAGAALTDAAVAVAKLKETRE